MLKLYNIFVYLLHNLLVLQKFIIYNIIVINIKFNFNFKYVLYYISIRIFYSEYYQSLLNSTFIVTKITTSLLYYLFIFNVKVPI